MCDNIDDCGDSSDEGEHCKGKLNFLTLIGQVKMQGSLKKVNVVHRKNNFGLNNFRYSELP